jgi:hypothetical protein
MWWVVVGSRWLLAVGRAAASDGEGSGSFSGWWLVVTYRLQDHWSLLPRDIFTTATYFTAQMQCFGDAARG